MTTPLVTDCRLHHALMIYVQRIACMCAATQEMQADVPVETIPCDRLASMRLAINGCCDSSPTSHHYHGAPRPTPCSPVNPPQYRRIRACERLDIGVIMPTAPLHLERKPCGNIDDGRPAPEDLVRNIPVQKLRSALARRS